ncbi:MAG: alpha/beta hydrolase [Pseudomonadota bacterium]
MMQDYPALVPLWPDGAPGALGNGPLDTPAISVHLPLHARNTGCGVLVCPGGGYRILASDHEGLQVANWLNARGIAAFVLRYRLGPTYDTGISHLDGQRAMRWIRSQAAAFGVDKRRLGMLGFSAGGHLTAAVGTNYDPGDPGASDVVERESSRPDFLVPVYAVINGLARGRKADEYTPTDTRVTADTPPSFIMHTHEDMTVPSNQSLLFYQALRAAGVQAELHVFGYGDHGLGLGVGDPDLNNWPDLLLNWLRRSRFLTDRTGVAIRGRVLIDGRAPGMAWISLLPADPDAPLARTKINRSAAGFFEIPAERGPVPGPHTLQVHHISEGYPHTGDGIYTLSEVACYERPVDIQPEITLEWDIAADEWAT